MAPIVSVRTNIEISNCSGKRFSCFETTLDPFYSDIALTLIALLYIYYYFGEKTVLCGRAGKREIYIMFYEILGSPGVKSLDAPGCFIGLKRVFLLLLVLFL